MGIKLTNNANATLAAGINSSATSITLTSGQGARFPTLTASDYFYATLIDTSNNLEIVKCTARSTDVLTVVRGQESTTARAYVTGDRIEIRLTAQTFIDAVNEIGPTQVSDEVNSSTGYFALPSGTTAQRPGSPTGNMIRKNTSTGYIEYYDPTTTSWIGLGAFSATGGTETTYNSGGIDYKVHTFTSSGTFQVTTGAKSVDFLVIAGGAGGVANRGSGGGGAGGYRCSVTGESSGGGGAAESQINVVIGSYTITVGAGGARGTHDGGTPAANGSNSVFGSITSIGGGFGGTNLVSNAPFNGTAGGSGGGGGSATNNGGTGGSGTAGQGYAGGNTSGTATTSEQEAGAGGGGAGAVGGSTSSSSAAAGGNGVSSSINGTATTRAGGGGGGKNGSSSGAGAGGSGGGGAGFAGSGSMPGSFATSGTANTGGGGGGGGANAANGGNGGSGIVIIRYTI
jgi:hypothetical protein